jgi:aspartate kinase
MTSYMEKHSVDGLSIDCENLMISLKRVPFNNFIMSRLLSELATAGVNVDIISRSAPVDNAFDVSLIVLESALPKVEQIIQGLSQSYPAVQISINTDITRLSLHGIGMRTQSGVAARFLQVFADHGIPILMITTSEISIACIVRNADAKEAVDALREAFKL